MKLELRINDLFHLLPLVLVDHRVGSLKRVTEIVNQFNLKAKLVAQTHGGAAWPCGGCVGEIQLKVLKTLSKNIVCPLL